MTARITVERTVVRRCSSIVSPVVLALFLCPIPVAANALAGPLLDAAIEAEKLAAGGDAPAALAKIQEGMARFSESLPLTVPRAVFITERPAAYGSYTAKPNTVFQPGEPLMTYIEVIGLRWTKLAEDKVETHFTIDMQLTSASGRLVALKEGFGNIRYPSRVAAQEVFTHLTLDLGGAEPGGYVLRYTVNDVVSERSVSFELPFSIAKPG